MRPPKKLLSFHALRSRMSDVFLTLPDSRSSDKIKHALHDVVMSGFAMMYFQDPSILQFQKRMEDEWQKNNLKSLFNVQTIPMDSQMRGLIDGVDCERFRPLFNDYFFRLQRGKYLESYQIFPGLYLCALDGSQYFGSENIQCPHCLIKNHRGGSMAYSHHVLQSAIMHPDHRQVIPLMPEEICNEDGTEKQDCEMNAGKRLIRKIRKDHPQLGIVNVGDGLFSKQPFIEATLEERMHYIYVAKPDDHKILMEWVEEQKNLGETKRKDITDSKGRRHVYEWVHEVPLNGSEKTIMVNFFRYELIVENEVTYKNSWVTDLAITEDNVETLVRAGRCRWKIENECFNTLKNQGYSIEHNYGHGSKNLSFNFLILTLLAFLFHQIFELTDDLYKTCRKKFGSKRHLWECLRQVIRIILFQTWEQLLHHILSPPRIPSTAPL